VEIAIDPRRDRRSRRIRIARPAVAFLLATLLPCLLAASGCGMAAYQNNSTGVQLFEQGNYDGAARRFQQAIADDPAFSDGYYNLASTHHRLWKLRGTPNDAAQAEQLYRLSIDRNPEHREAYRSLATLMNEQGRAQEAFILINTWATRSAKPAEARVELAKLYQEYNDYASAQARLREAIELDPRNARAFAELAQLQERIGDPAQALTNYSRSYDLDRAQPQVEQKIASLRSIQGGSIFAPASTPATRTAAGGPPALPRY
jgi:Tfp pilus assembly protein PilF